MKKIVNTKKRALKIFAKLDKVYPDAGCELDFKNPLELLIATILAAQCTDARVNQVTPELFRKFRTVKDFAKADIPELEAMIRTTGFFRNKAKSIKNACGQMVGRHGGTVPKEMDELTALAGVGRKTANVIRAYSYGLPGIIVDTHFLRVTARLGLTKNTDPVKVEADLAAIIPEKNWTRFSTLITIHGRRCCFARKPACAACPILQLCPFGIAAGTSPEKRK